MDTADIRKLCNIAEASAVQVAFALKDDFSRLNSVRVNEGKDIKLDADRKAEDMLFELLGPTGFEILSEERGASSKNCLDGPCWILDPLDGTFNYNRGFPVYAISIAFWMNDSPAFGVIYDIANAKCYSGQVGSGAWCNGEKIQVSGVYNRAQAVLATGFPSGRSFESSDLEIFVRSVQSYKKIRMIGSAALSLANVAAGVFDIYTEQDIWIWDVAAGLALVQAAGGKVSHTKIKENWKFDVTAWNGNFEPECR